MSKPYYFHMTSYYFKIFFRKNQLLMLGYLVAFFSLEKGLELLKAILVIYPSQKEAAISWISGTLNKEQILNNHITSQNIFKERDYQSWPTISLRFYDQAKYKPPDELKCRTSWHDRVEPKLQRSLTKSTLVS